MMRPFQGEAVFAWLAELVGSTNTTDFAVARFDGSALLLIGSSDLSYYHEAEVLFTDVFYLQLYTPYLGSPGLRYACAEEVARFPHLDLEPGERLFALTTDGHASDGQAAPPLYFIGAGDVQARQCMVYHYPREGLQPGEEVWEWVQQT